MTDKRHTVCYSASTVCTLSTSGPFPFKTKLYLISRIVLDFYTIPFSDCSPVSSCFFHGPC